jgi:hypothetical protein
MIPTGGPRDATIVHGPWDDRQDATIVAPEGEEPMPVTAAAFMPHELAA